MSCQTVLPIANLESRSLGVLLSVCNLNSASVLHRPASFLGVRPRLVFGVQEEVGPACKRKAVLGLPIPSSINEAVAAEQEGANMFFTSQKVALGFELKQFSYN